MWFAAAATQNVAFTAPALLALGFGFAKQRWWLFARNKTALLLTAGMLSLQPIYCWSALGRLTSLRISGDVRFWEASFHAKCLIAYWVDPDLGMFANWLFAFPMVVLFFGLCVKGVVRFRRDAAVLTVFSILVLGWVQTLTANINHGGTVNISRYCPWFLFLNIEQFRSTFLAFGIRDIT